MKPSTFLLLTFGLGQVFASPAGTTPVMRDAATHEQLSQGLQQARLTDPMRTLKATTGGDPSLKAVPEDLIRHSDILCFNGLATLVPKRAILTTPGKLKDRLSMQANVKLVGWSEFFAVNRAWITTEEVTYAQAAGTEPMPEATNARIGKSINLVMATYLGGPISVAVPAAAPTTPQPQN